MERTGEGCGVYRNDRTRVERSTKSAEAGGPVAAGYIYWLIQICSQQATAIVPLTQQSSAFLASLASLDACVVVVAICCPTPDPEAALERAAISTGPLLLSPHRNADS